MPKMNPFLQRVIANKELTYADGYLLLMGVPSYLYALNSLVVMQNALQAEFSTKGSSVMFHLFGYQAGNAAKLMKNRFGFPTEKALQAQQGHLDMLGAGNADFVRLDLKNNHFILRGEPTFAKEYVKTFGYQKKPVDWMMKGGITYMLNEYLDRDDMVVVETSCIAMGNKFCEFVAKPKKNWKAAEIKEHLPVKFKTNFAGIIAKNALGMPKRK